MRKLKLRYYKASGIYIAKNKPFENKAVNEINILIKLLQTVGSYINMNKNNNKARDEN